MRPRVGGRRARASGVPVLTDLDQMSPNATALLKSVMTSNHIQLPPEMALQALLEAIATSSHQEAPSSKEAPLYRRLVVATAADLVVQRQQRWPPDESEEAVREYRRGREDTKGR